MSACPESRHSPAPQWFEIASLSGLRDLAGEWRDLWERCPRATPFQHPDWLLPWWNVAGAGLVRALALRAGGRLAGLAPLYSDPDGIVRLIGCGVSDYLDVLIEPEWTWTARALLDRLSGTTWDFPDMPPWSPLVTAGASAAGVRVTSVCPFVEAKGGFRNFLSTLPRGFRRNLERARRQLVSAGCALRFESASPDNAGEFLEALIRLHGSRWKERSETGVFADEVVRSFHRSAVPSLVARGLAFLEALLLENEFVALLYGLRRERRVYFYIGGFEQRLARFSPGTLLLAESIRKALENGAVELDFLRGSEPYKYLWGARDRPLYGLSGRATLARQ